MISQPPPKVLTLGNMDYLHQIFALINCTNILTIALTTEYRKKLTTYLQHTIPAELIIALPPLFQIIDNNGRNAQDIGYFGTRYFGCYENNNKYYKKRLPNIKFMSEEQNAFTALFNVP